jgi:hypothetical protein
MFLPEVLLTTALVGSLLLEQLFKAELVWLRVLERG